MKYLWRIYYRVYPLKAKYDVILYHCRINGIKHTKLRFWEPE